MNFEWILNVLDTTPWEVCVMLNFLFVVVLAVPLALWIDSRPTLLEKSPEKPIHHDEERPLFARAAA